jgi:hypothetical protein
MSRFLNTGIVTHEFTITDEALKRALAREAMDAFQLCDENGKPLPGVTYAVLHEGKRPHGHYAVRVTRDLSKSEQAKLPPPVKA